MCDLKKIGLFCGCFNPVHNGHISAAEAFKSYAGLDRLYLIPANASYSKYGRFIESGSHRVKMCELAVSGHAGLAVSDFEIRCPKACYTLDTVLYFKKQFAAAEFYLCMGEDTAETVTRWACFPELKEQVRFLVIDRNGRGGGVDALTRSGANTAFVAHDRDGISSTDIRRKLGAGESAAGLDDKVFRYIRENALYGTPVKNERRSSL